MNRLNNNFQPDTSISVCAYGVVIPLIQLTANIFPLPILARMISTGILFMMPPSTSNSPFSLMMGGNNPGADMLVLAFNHNDPCSCNSYFNLDKLLEMQKYFFHKSSMRVSPKYSLKLSEK